MAEAKVRKVVYSEDLGKKKISITFTGPWNRAHLDRASRLMHRELRKHKIQMRREEDERRRQESESE